MKTRIFCVGLSLALTSLTGCPAPEEPEATGDGVADDDDDGPDDDGGEGTTAGTPDDGGDDDGDGTESDGGDESETGMTFVIPQDGLPTGIFECDLWLQDCPSGEKCMPYAGSGGTWDATRCSEIADTPDQAGDTCTVEGNGASGIDSCDVGAMCWDVDPETNEGVCVGMCTGNSESPICEDPTTTCSITNGGALILCLPECLPLLQDCPDDQACYPVGGTFACAPDVSGEMGIYGDPCEFINVCDPGLACLDPAAVGEASCAGAGGCCGAYCDLTSGEDCPGAGVGQECTSPFAEGAVPPGYEDTGWCVIPA